MIKVEGMEISLKNNIESMLKNIEFFGDKYCEKYLSDWNKDLSLLENNWWEGLKFFFRHSFMRGRRDELSDEFCEFTLTIIKENIK